jgi:hypothetical protein
MIFQGQLETIVEASTSTAINFFMMNFSIVDCQTLPPRKWFATQCATEWLFTCVNFCMLIKIGATVWPFTCMKSGMSIKITFPNKEFSAL